MKQCLLLIFLLAALLGCEQNQAEDGATEPTSDTTSTAETAQLCVETVTSEGYPIGASVAISTEKKKEQEIVGCTPISVNTNYVLTPSTVEGYKTPETKKITAGSILAGETRPPLRFVYTAMPQAPSTSTEALLIIKAVDQFDNLINGEIFLNDVSIGTSKITITVDSTKEHIISFGEIAGYSTPTEQTFKADSEERIFKGSYERVGSTNVCFNAINEFGGSVQTTLQDNGIELFNHCFAMDPTTDHRVIAIDGPANFAWPPQFQIPAGKLREGEAYAFELIFLPSAVAIYGCTETHGGQGESFLNGRSIGWAIDEELACFYAADNSENVLSFGEVSGLETARDINLGEFESGAVFHALYGWNEQALACFTVKTPWGDPIWTATAFVSNSNETLRFSNQEGLDCVALDPSETSIVTFGYEGQEDNNSLVPPPPLTIATGTMTAGETKNFSVVYAEQVPDPQPRERWEVRLIFTDQFGYPVRGLVSWTDQYGPQSGSDSRFSWTLNENIPTQNFSFLQVGYLTPSMSQLNIDISALSELDANFFPGTDPSDPNSGWWEWSISYATADPAARVCIQSLNNNGAQLAPPIWFDGLESSSPWNEAVKCGILPTGESHVLHFGGIQSYQGPLDIMIPTGKLYDGQELMFTRTFVLSVWARQACLGVSMSSQAYLNGESLGWASGSPKQICFVYDSSKVNTLSFENREGCITPTPIVIPVGAEGGDLPPVSYDCR